mgnify:CR=1 FL=1
MSTSSVLTFISNFIFQFPTSSNPFSSSGPRCRQWILRLPLAFTWWRSRRSSGVLPCWHSCCSLRGSKGIGFLVPFFCSYSWCVSSSLSIHPHWASAKLILKGQATNHWSYPTGSSSVSWRRAVLWNSWSDYPYSVRLLCALLPSIQYYACEAWMEQWLLRLYSYLLGFDGPLSLRPH